MIKVPNYVELSATHIYMNIAKYNGRIMDHLPDSEKVPPREFLFNVSALNLVLPTHHSLSTDHQHPRPRLLRG